MIIGVTGRMGSGKSTAAAYLVKEKGFKDIRFATYLKQLLQIAFNLSEDQLEGEMKNHQDPRWPIPAQILPTNLHGKWYGLPETGVYLEPKQKFFTPRNLLQILGTEWFRSISPSYWIDIVIREIGQLLSCNPSTNIVVSDCRFVNEADAIRSLGCMIVKITRSYEQTHKSINHPSESETDMIKHDYIIQNNGTIEEMHKQIDDIINKIRKERVNEHIF